MYENNAISDSKKIAFFDLEKLNDTLETQSRSIVEKMEGKWWFPNNILDLEYKDQALDYRQIALNGSGTFWRWLIYPFSSDKAKNLHPLPSKKPFWNWGAFFIPELWFLYHEIWGVFLFIGICYILPIFLGVYAHFNPFGKPLLFLPVMFRLIAGRYGNDIYYVMHGKWPNAKWNVEAGTTSSKP